MFHGGIGFALGHAVALGEQLEVVDQGFHVVFHLDARGWHDLVVIDHHRAGIFPQPVDALANDAVGLAQFFHAHEIAVVAVAVDAHGDIEIHAVVHFVRLFLAQVPFHTGAPQHRTREAELHGALRRHDADVDRPLLPDAVVRQQRFVLVDAARKLVRERLDEIQQRTLSRLVQPLQIGGAAELGFLVLRHRIGQIAIDAARAIVGSVHARTRDGLVEVHQVFALAEAVKEHRHRTDVQAVRPEPHQVVQYPGDLVEHDADILRPLRHLDAEQLLDREDVAVLVAHHRHVVESVHVTDALVERLRLGEFFGPAVQQTDVRVRLLDRLAVHLEHQAKHAVRRGMLRPEIHRVVLDLSHRPGP